MLWIFGHYKYFYSHSVGIHFRRQNLISTDVRFWRIKTVPALQGLKWLREIFIFFRFKKQHFYQLSKKPKKTKPTMCTPKVWLNVGTELGQRCADNRCYREITQSLSSHPQLPSVPVELPLAPWSMTVCMCGIKWCKMRAVLFTWQYTTWK